MRSSKVAMQQNPSRNNLNSSTMKENNKIEIMQNIINQNCGVSPSVMCPESKLNYLESNLNRVCLQQDALMPLLSMVEFIPAIQKCECTLKNVTKKLDEQENRQVKVERIIEQRLKEKNDKSPFLKSETAKLSKTVDTLNSQFKDLENNLSSIHRQYEAKLKEESYSIQRNIEAKLEKQKNDLKNQIFSIKSSTSPIESMNASTIHINRSEMVSRDELSCFKKEVLSQIKVICFDKIDNIRQDLNSEMRNIYKEIGGLRCEIEYISNIERKNKISFRVQEELSEKSLSQIEQQLKINILEQDCFVEDLDSFNKENSIRIVQEVNSIREDCQNMVNELQTRREIDQSKILKKQNEIEYLFEKNVNLKYQLAGTKKKFVNEVKRIEEKFIIIDQIKSALSNDEISQDLENDFITATRLEQKLGQLMMNINRNLDSDMIRISETESDLISLKQHFMETYQ